MSWNQYETTLHHFHVLLGNIFDSIPSETTLVLVHGSFLVFNFSVPLSATESIMNTAKEKQQLLLELGVVSITVGIYVVFKVKKYFCYDIYLIYYLCSKLNLNQTSYL